MKLFVFNFLVFCSAAVFSQEVVVQEVKEVKEIKKVEQTYPLPAPIEVEVPYYQPRTQIEKINTVLRDSEFFFEMNPLRISGSSFDFTSDQTTFVKPDFEVDDSEFDLNLLPLDFKFGFNNVDWGSFAEVNLQENSQDSEMVIYGRSNGHKFGAGFGANISKDKVRLKSNGVLIGKGESKLTEVTAYFYSSFMLIDNSLLTLEQWNKFGGGYQRISGADLIIKGLLLRVEPAIELMFKINNKLQIGTGFELRYERFGGHIYMDSSDFKGVADNFGYEFNIIKTRFNF